MRHPNPPSGRTLMEYYDAACVEAPEASRHHEDTYMEISSSRLSGLSTISNFSNSSEDKPGSSKRKSSMDNESDQLSPGKRPKDNDPTPFSIDDIVTEQFLDLQEDPMSNPWVQQFHAMDAGQQSSALFFLVKTLKLHQARMIRRTVEPFFQRDFLAETPVEVGLHILSFLKPRDLVHAAGVSRQWRKLCEDTLMWQRICERLRLPVDSEGNSEEPSNRFDGGWKEHPTLHRSLYLSLPEPKEQRLVADERKVLEGPIFQRCPYKARYMRWRRIVNNWRQKKIAAVCVLKGHEENVITCLQISGDTIVTGSDDNTLKVWSISHGSVRHTLMGHVGGVWTAQIDQQGKYLVSGSTDRTVKIWSLETGECLHTLIGHTSTVRCLAICNNIIISGSRDATLRAWSLETGHLLNQFVGHLAAVRCVQFDGLRVVSGAYDFAVRVWNVQNGLCLFTMAGHTNRVYSLLMDSPRNIVVSGSLDTTIRVWDISPGRGDCVSVLIGHTSLTSGMQIVGNMLVSCNADSSIRVWNIRDGTCAHRLHGPNGHQSAITSLQTVRDGLIVTSSDDGSVKLWDIHKGVFVRDILRLSSSGSGGCVWRLKATDNLLVCAVGSRNGTEETKLVLLDFDSSFP